MAFTKIVGAGIHTLSNVHTHNINSSGIITATSFVGPLDGTTGDFSGNVTIDGNLVVNGTTTTLDTNLTEVDKVEVAANNSTVGVAITQSGSGDLLRLYDGTSQVVTVDDEGNVGIGTNTLFTSGAHSGTHQLTVTGNAPSMILGVSNNDQLYIRRELADGKFTFQSVQGGGNNGVISLQPYGGSVGIGSETPAQKLDVVGNSIFRGEVAISSGNEIKLSNNANTASATIDCDGGARLHLKSYNQSVATFEEGVGTIFYQGSSTNRLQIEPTGGVVVGAGGTIKIPDKMMHVGDEDTYLQFTDNTINLHAGGTTGLSVQSASVRVPTKLGINGAAPQTPLDVIANGSGYAMAIRGRSSDNTAELRFTSNDYGTLYGQIVTGPTYLNLKTGGVERLQLDASEATFNSTGADTDFRIFRRECMRMSPLYFEAGLR